MSLEIHHCCFYSVFTIKLYFSTAKVKMDRRKFFFELGLPHLLEDSTSGSHFLLWLHTRGGFIPRPFGFEYIISHQSKGLWNNLSYWNNVSYHHFIQCCPSLVLKLSTQEETRTSRRNECSSPLNVLKINKQNKISLLWESICIFQSLYILNLFSYVCPLEDRNLIWLLQKKCVQQLQFAYSTVPETWILH